jgi:glycosyltransferase involved in cell wall biosynthesis
MPAPQVSVVLTTRNRSSMMRQALSSVLGQDSVALEAIVVDEGSSDDTPARLEQIEDERLTVLRHESPKGLPAARNAAIDRARGEWIAFLDDDDLWAPGKLRTQLALAASNGHTLLYSGRFDIDERTSVIRITRPADPRELPLQLLANNSIGTASSVVMRADLLERVGGFDERLPALEDWDLWIRAASSAKPGACREPLIAYRRHREGMSTNPTRMLAAFELLKAKHGAVARQAGIEFGSAWLARWTAAQDLAAGRRLQAAGHYLRITDLGLRDIARALGALGGPPFQRLARSGIARITSRPDWLDRYA